MLDGQIPELIKNKVVELAEFLKMPEEEVYRLAFQTNTESLVGEVWKEKNPQSQSERNLWYQETNQYLFNLIWFEYVKESQVPLHASLANICKQRNYKKVLDFGGGTGGTLLFISNEVPIEANYYDLQGVGSEFAKFRVNKRGLQNFNFIDSEDKVNDYAPYDFIICLDVLEHIENPPKYGAWLTSMLRKGGTMFLSAPFIASGEHFPYPMHLEQNQKYGGSFGNYLESLGLKQDGSNLWYKPEITL